MHSITSNSDFVTFICVDHPALVHSLLKYKYLFGYASDKKYDMQMHSMQEKEKEEKKEEEKKKPEKKKPLQVCMYMYICIMVAINVNILLILFLSLSRSFSRVECIGSY